MAKGKRSFIFYADWIDTFKELPPEDGYELLMHLLSYVNDENPQTDSVLINAVFANMKNRLKEDLVKWEDRADRSRENGAKGGRPKNPEKPSGLNKNPDEPRKPDSVTVTVSVTVSEVVNYLNIKSGKNFKPSTNGTKTHINARLTEGYNLDDFKKVIDVKCKQWKDDKDMAKYLRPSTLFSPKFESYLNEDVEKKPVLNFNR